MQDMVGLVFGSMGAIGVIGFVVLMLVLFVLWVCMPFAIFGMKPLMRQLLAEQKKTNALLQAQADRAKEIRERAERL